MSERVARRKIFRGKVYPADREGNPYLMLPFEVPPGAGRIEIGYAYDGEGNILDLGVFDSRGCGFLTPGGFRGWSGSARRKVVIGEDWATPGYLAGPLYPGTWHVILGLYRVSPRGCAYEVEVRIRPEPVEVPPERPVGERPLSREEGAIEMPGWLRGDLHCHTHHSEAQGSVMDLIAAAERKGLDFLAITDHNTTSHWGEMEEHGKGAGIILIPGEEVTTYWGHANVWGWGRWLDFRCRTREEMERVYDAASSEGRIFSINHPKPGGPPWEFGYDLPFDCIEVWHGLWSMGNEYSLETWRRLLAAGRRVVAVGGSDAHPRFNVQGRLIEWLGYPTTWVWTEELSSTAILTGIRAGHVSISACPEGPLVSIAVKWKGDTFRQGEAFPFAGKAELEVEVREGAGLELALISWRGELARKRILEDQWKAIMSVDLAKEGYVRAELRVPVPALPPDRWPMAALANPVWHESFLVDKIKDLRRER